VQTAGAEVPIPRALTHPDNSLECAGLAAPWSDANCHGDDELNTCHQSDVMPPWAKSGAGPAPFKELPLYLRLLKAPECSPLTEQREKPADLQPH
jgi:hypothetical protein